MRSPPSLINIGGIDFNDNMPLRNQPPVINTVPGAIDIQKFEDEGNWLSQSGDPVAWAPFIRKSPLPGNTAKSFIIQFARGDKVVPNPTTTALIRSGDLADRTTLFRNDLAFPLGIGFSNNPHTFLFDLTSCLTTCDAAAGAAIEAQTQIAVFFASNGALTIDPDSVGLVCRSLCLKRRSAVLYLRILPIFRSPHMGTSALPMWLRPSSLRPSIVKPP